jgi:hypothetical protein
MEGTNWIFDIFQNSITPLKDLNVKGNVNSRLTSMNIAQIYMKVKFEDLIKFLIG